jgi:hypothetical protein
MKRGASKLDCPLRSDLLRKTIVMEINLKKKWWIEWFKLKMVEWCNCIMVLWKNGRLVER